MLKTTILAASRRSGSPARRARRRSTQAAHVTDFRFSFEGPFGRFDQAQLQRGLQVYTEVCSACHGLQVRDLPRARRARRAGDDRGADARLRRDARRRRRGDRRDPAGDAVGPLPALAARERARPQPDGQGAGRLPRAGRPAASTSSCTASAGRSTSPRCCSASPARSESEAGATLYENHDLPGRLDRDAAAARATTR